MAVDKKSDHYTSPDNYTDIDGNLKTFSYVDWDVKSKMGARITPEEANKAKRDLADYRVNLVQKIMDISPSYCPEMFWDFTFRGERETINWNRQMLVDEGVPLDRLQQIYTLTSNRQEARVRGLI